jgi:signal transduction histidine kinase
MGAATGIRGELGRTELSVLRGLATFRWLAWAWMATVLALARGGLVRPVLAVGLVAAAAAVTVWHTRLLRAAPDEVTSPRVVGVEVGVALALQVADGIVYRPPHVFTAEQPLGVAWPVAAALSSGVAFGPAVGAATGLALGVARAVSSVLAVVPDPEPWLGVLTASEVLSLVTTTVLYVLAGGVAGYAVGLVRDAERRVTTAERRLAEVRAREDVARRLHDGVLQTLAIVERRTDDAQLARLARDQERELRGYLFGAPGTGLVGSGALGDALRDAAGRFESHHGGRVEVLVPDDLPDLDAEVVDALAGAVGEALTNAGKHGRAERVVVYVDPDDPTWLAVSVRDDGVGFDPATTPEGVGLSRSIRGRLAEVGGRVELTSAPGRGTELHLGVPTS